MPVNAKVAAKPSQESIPFSSAEEARKLFYLLLKGRLVDEGNRKLFRTGKFLGTYYSAVGQEATTIVPAFLLRREDIIAPQHREIGCSIGREVPLNLMMAHNMGRKSGFDKGKNHPCHYGGTKWNIITPASTMAAQTVVGTGCALAFKLQKKDNVVIAFTGEGGTSQAGWHEACNLAGVHKLPMVFVCQNNLWAESVPASQQAAIKDFSDRAKAYGFPGISIDGNDVITVYNTVKEAIARARRGEGSTLVEMKTYRWYGHSEIDPADYRTNQEVEEWKKKDPLPRFEKYLMDKGIITKSEVEQWTAEIKQEHEEAVEWATNSPLPAPEEAIEDVYVPGTRVEEMHREQNRNFY